ncbi:GAK system CofD-like protein [Desulfovibrio mangrovi]|uniref:GAK system CofD-like protein n=1 Tax=Desulfovibrio mangrovi TaxID=2976983 RepID=UPI00224606A7|nr:GAK system CofD-like protein [Desulfovibrio mangrovi]UZP67106.1 GAK system CofD-like protein [Desulfovibrio mangrovi]
MHLKQHLTITREITIPDPLKLERFRHAPQLGPKALFFSGGSALHDLAQQLTHYTHNSVHLITPFDSGGSSAVLRQAFDMPAVGDIRSRLMALADQSIQGNPAIFDLFVYRMAQKASDKDLADELKLFTTGTHALMQPIPEPMREIIRNNLQLFADQMPQDFDLHGASIGNLVLTAGYTSNRKQLDPAIYLFSKLVEVRGIVRPVVDSCAHLAVRLANNEIVVGQHMFTGKWHPPVQSPIEDIWLTPSLHGKERIGIPLCDNSRRLIAQADLICYPMGSFYSSIIATLLPDGIGKAIAASRKPKVFIPNTGTDPELFGHDLSMQVERLLHTLRKDAPDNIKDSDVLNAILLDTKNGRYNGTLNRDALAARGIAVLDLNLISEQSAPLVDGKLLSDALLSFC